MTEEEVKLATCQVLAAGEAGTGWLISPDRVLTAYHCVDVEGETEDDKVITVRFGVGDSVTEQRVSIVSFDEDHDVCLLKLESPSAFLPIPIELGQPQLGVSWYAFGYPVAKLELGSVLQGVVQQTLAEKVLGVDLDLSVNADNALSDYSGLSGSAMMVGPRCQGMLRVNVHRSLGAVSFAELEAFLRANDLVPDDVPQSEEPYIALRPAFNELLETRVTSQGRGYVLLEGAHGIGKSTYCRNFTPDTDSVVVLGVYAFSDGSRGSTPAHQAQPEVFVGWLESLWSLQATGKPARLTERSYAQLIQSTSDIFQAFASRCESAGKVGVLFIDGINEAAGVSGDGLQRFLELLPQSLPGGLVVVITGAGLDALGDKLGRISNGADRLALPVLNQDAQREFCYASLEQHRANPQIVTFLCDRAKGHPLYLRYLIDMVNAGASAEDLTAIPLFSGSIQDYYETIWSQLLPDDAAVNLLGIIARLRWGISISDLTAMLTPSESEAFVPTLARIRHLLSTPEKTEIYHSSFSEFVVEKTSALGERIQSRLAEFCLLESSGDYGALNRIYHGLLADLGRQSRTLEECQQEWVDQSVLLGAEPDILLGDVDDVLNTATRIGTATDIIRLLLLSQRLSFRYNTLFAQSAGLVAQALVSLGNTQQALRHILRYGHLIVSPEDAFTIVVKLVQANQLDAALTVLEKIYGALAFQASREQSKNDFLYVTSLRMHTLALIKFAGGAVSFSPFLMSVIEIIRDPRNSFPVDVQQEIVQDLLGNMLGSALCLESLYTSISSIPLPADADPRQKMLALRSTLMHANSYAHHYGIRLDNNKVRLLLSDIESLTAAPLQPVDMSLDTIDLLIMAGASQSQVNAHASGFDLAPERMSFYTNNRAMPDQSVFGESFQQFRAAFFLNNDCTRPDPFLPSTATWEDALQSIGQAIAWCDGAARRARAANDLAELDQVRCFLVSKVLPCLTFSLSSRIQWADSYSIPETIVPFLYDQLSRLCLDCLPDATSVMLDHIDEAFDVQLGVYNEGFRQTLQTLINNFTNGEIEEDLADKVLGLLFRWKEYVQGNVENRHELIPDLLQMIPLFANMGATEEAMRIYHRVLAVSMGPSWYKEDQLSLMSGVLEALPKDANVSAAALQKIATYLERASGEMTFQRYVRADKGNYIGQLCRRGMYEDAVRYFKHQSCGSLKQLYGQASEGDLDRISPLVGMRFPGGLLEEQASVLQLLEHLHAHAEWRLRWALLEIYQHGDERHLGDWGREYARIILELVDNPTDLAWVTSRTRVIAHSMNFERACLLLRGLVHTLPDLHGAPFTDLLRNIEKSLSRRTLEQLASGLGGQYKAKPDEDKERGTDSQESSEDLDRMDALYLPGTFGKQSAIRESERAVEEARKQLKLRNDSAAINACIESLKVLQAGGWPIWTAGHSSREAEVLLRDKVANADDLVKLYGPMALQERYAERWRIASRLIELTAEKLSSEQQSAVVSTAIEHIAQIIGDVPSDAFSYIGAGNQGNASGAVLELILSTLDHPQWERRDGAAAMVLWLLRSGDSYIEDLVQLAFSMTPDNRADITLAALDILSEEKPVALWQRICPYLNANKLVESCQHVGRYVVLMRIAERAGKREDESAATFATFLREKFTKISSPNAPDKKIARPAYWPLTLNPTWEHLGSIGVLDDAAIQRFESELAQICTPLSITIAAELEEKLAQGFREADAFPLGRWAMKLRYALQIALFAYSSSVEKLSQIEAALRTYNPSSLLEPGNGREIIASLTQAILKGRVQAYKPSDNNFIYLDFQCWIELGKEVRRVELISFLIPPMPQAMRSPLTTSFTSTELPHSGRDERLAICDRVQPVVAHFGSFTPAVATPQFLQLIGVGQSATGRFHWRDGGTVSSRPQSRRYEASMLAVRREAFILPAGWSVNWALRVDGETLAILDRY